MMRGNLSARLAARVLVSGMALFISQAAMAEIYKCPQADGKIIFSDKPCAGGKGSELNLGANIEDPNPTGTAGDVSGSFTFGERRVEIKDAMSFLDRANSRLLLLLVPVNFTSQDLEYFRDSGKSDFLQRKPGLDAATFPRFPYLAVTLNFKSGQELSKESLESLDLEFQPGMAEPQFNMLHRPLESVKTEVRFLSVFQNITDGDIQMETESSVMHEGHAYRWQFTIRAPVYILP